jgi:hypothetical protein
MRQARRDVDLAAEPLVVGVGQVVGLPEDLDGDVAVQSQVIGLIDTPEASAAELAADLVTVQPTLVELWQP